MTTSLLIGVAVIVAILAWMIWSRSKESHHLDDVHIVDEGESKEP